jgi:hypothetical protein
LTKEEGLLPEAFRAYADSAKTASVLSASVAKHVDGLAEIAKAARVGAAGNGDAVADFSLLSGLLLRCQLESECLLVLHDDGFLCWLMTTMGTAVRSPVLLPPPPATRSDGDHAVLRAVFPPYVYGINMDKHTRFRAVRSSLHKRDPET